VSVGISGNINRGHSRKIRDGNRTKQETKRSGKNLGDVHPYKRFSVTESNKNNKLQIGPNKTQFTVPVHHIHL
jgi:hypothetical protein